MSKHKHKVNQGATPMYIPKTNLVTSFFTLRNFLIALLIIRLISGIFYSLEPIHGLHIWRQTDVLSVAYSYYLRFFVEGNFSHFLLPSVLNTDNGEFSIVRMEFPFVNFIISPTFIFGSYWGRVVANLIIIAINYGLIFYNYCLLRTCLESF